jgi:probable Rubsico expression protein CbbX
MRTARLPYFRLGLLLAVTAALVLCWLLLSIGMFAVFASLIVSFALILLVFWDGWRQTTLDNLAERGIYPTADRIPTYDPGLRREWQPLIPPGVGMRTSGRRLRRQKAPSATRVRRQKAPSASPVRRQPAPSAVRTPPRTAPSATMTKPAQAKPAQNGQNRRRTVALQPDATVNLADERQVAGVDDLFAALDSELVGLFPVKQKVEEIGSLLLVDRARQRFGLSASRPNLHMCFTGAPGTGKTTVGLMMADLLHRLGYLETDNLVHAMRDDLVGEYIGHTAPKTKHVLDRAMGGVLFIDEAYNLFRGEDSRDYGQECVDILMQVMENERDRLVVILAGYKDRMEEFFESNPGMRSRIAHHLDFAAYEVDELVAIGGLMLNRSSYYLSVDARTAFRDHLSQQMKHSRFANARSVRNALEGARLRHAFRLTAEPERPWSKDELMRLESSDILPSLEAR